MKWNFECESERRDYLHKYSVAPRNGFCSSLNNASFKDRAKLAVRRSLDTKPITFPDDSTNETIVAREPCQRQRAGIRCRPSLVSFNSRETPGSVVQFSRSAPDREAWSDPSTRYLAPNM